MREFCGVRKGCRKCFLTVFTVHIRSQIMYCESATLVIHLLLCFFRWSHFFAKCENILWFQEKKCHSCLLADSSRVHRPRGSVLLPVSWRRSLLFHGRPALRVCVRPFVPSCPSGFAHVRTSGAFQAEFTYGRTVARRRGAAGSSRKRGCVRDPSETRSPRKSGREETV